MNYRSGLAFIGIALLTFLTVSWLSGELPSPKQLQAQETTPEIIATITNTVEGPPVSQITLEPTSATGIVSTATIAATPTLSVSTTITPSATITATSIQNSPIATPTFTPIPAINTPIPTSTFTPIPTNTFVPASTPMPTSTSIPQPTSPLETPTSTPLAESPLSTPIPAAISPLETPTPQPTITITETETEIPTETPTETGTAIPEPTASYTLTPMPTPLDTATLIPALAPPPIPPTGTAIPTSEPTTVQDVTQSPVETVVIVTATPTPFDAERPVLQPTPIVTDYPMLAARIVDQAVKAAGWIWFLCGSLIFFGVAGLAAGLFFRQQEGRRYHLQGSQGLDEQYDYDLVDDGSDLFEKDEFEIDEFEGAQFEGAQFEGAQFEGAEFGDEFEDIDALYPEEYVDIDSLISPTPKPKRSSLDDEDNDDINNGDDYWPSSLP